ncbi:MAG: 2-C-methyl-D-erythritol 2,4-cyclodiphosphate synthase [Candidatus Omnitrophica bacterium]|nr:2-C-methyl-D-erythritol 2,4-cyclodiphosphate synthase [Candidatus Omnitrophota bacterium]MDD5081123.1 2-C-methyl-D-erythritol 2,4-cyclodiphosphate synthase [Candidatus Omnitrophota bacterium]
MSEREYYSGLGFDVHSFANEPKPLILGGAKLSDDNGLLAVSDGDVLLHAVCDAICGACCLGDIGDYFPPEDDSSKGIDSKNILDFILKKIDGHFRTVNIDVTLIADRPKLKGYKEQIKNSLITLLGTESVNIKIKSKEQLPILGGADAIACIAVAGVAGC